VYVYGIRTHLKPVDGAWLQGSVAFSVPATEKNQVLNKESKDDIYFHLHNRIMFFIPVFTVLSADGEVLHRAVVEGIIGLDHLGIRSRSRLGKVSFKFNVFKA
jgi:hypothetical protein